MAKSPISTLLSILLPFACGVMYGLMSIGMKADREIMMAAARGHIIPNNDSKFQYVTLA